MYGPDDIRIMALFEESDIDAYAQKSARAAFDAVLATTGWSVLDVLAVARPFELLVIARAGIIECGEVGGFKKRIAVGEPVPWAEIVEIAQTEPTMRVYGIELMVAGEDQPRTYKWSGGGSRQSYEERNRVYGVIAAGITTRAPLE
jgi:hypothetical protein